MPNIADRVKETSVGTGTSSMPLLGAPTGFRSFLAAFGDAQPCYYCIAHDSLDEWETGYGTIESGAPDMLTRDEVFESTNANALVDFSPGGKTVFNCLPAQANVDRFGSGGGNQIYGSRVATGSLFIYGTLDSASGAVGLGGYVGHAQLYVDDANGQVSLNSDNDMTIQTVGLFIESYTGSTTVIFEFLPTSDPSVAGQLWNDSGTLKISAG